MKRLALAALAAGLAALSLVGAAQAGPKLHITTNEQVAIGSPSGTFAFSGDVSGGGAFVFDSFLSAGPPAFFLSTEHVVQTYLDGSAGTLSVQKQCLSVYVGGGVFSDTCQAVVRGGTGAYADAHGEGSCNGVISLVTGIATQTCELRLH
jgi:hypothetical protein